MLFINYYSFSLGSRASEIDVLLDVASDLHQIKRLIEECDYLIKQTTEIESSKEKVLYDILEFSRRLASSSKIIHNKCLIEIDSFKNNTDKCEFK